jgi:hypothetical protein
MTEKAGSIMDRRKDLNVDHLPLRITTTSSITSQSTILLVAKTGSIAGHHRTMRTDLHIFYLTKVGPAMDQNVTHHRHTTSMGLRHQMVNMGLVRVAIASMAPLLLFHRAISIDLTLHRLVRTDLTKVQSTLRTLSITTGRLQSTVNNHRSTTAHHRQVTLTSTMTIATTTSNLSNYGLAVKGSRNDWLNNRSLLLPPRKKRLATYILMHPSMTCVSCMLMASVLAKPPTALSTPKIVCSSI